MLVYSMNVSAGVVTLDMIDMDLVMDVLTNAQEIGTSSVVEVTITLYMKFVSCRKQNSAIIYFTC